MVLQLDEIFTELGKLTNRDARRAYFLQQVKSNNTIIPYIQMAFHEDKKISGLPFGYPPGPQGRPLIDKHVPAGMGLTELRHELRRFASFRKGGDMDKLPSDKRLNQWARLIEGLQWQEAELITKIKDGELLQTYPGLLDVLDLAGVTFKDPSLPNT